MPTEKEAAHFAFLAGKWNLQTPEDLDAFLATDEKTKDDPAARDRWRAKFAAAVPGLARAGELAPTTVKVSKVSGDVEVVPVAERVFPAAAISPNAVRTDRSFPAPAILGPNAV